ncbi:hypothetical protein ABMA27_008646 [Loxostege sticticalis]|uniref:Uncharacterized protein n=1 Tax=Loxostege sticticalis TaxID=481309 RepID=A0ABR3HC44_LOXSC
MQTIGAGRVRSFIWEDEQWTQNMHALGFGCNRQIFHLFIQLVNWKMNFNKCAVEKGSGTFSRFDYNLFQHALEPETYYGRWRWLYEATSKGKSITCLAVETIVNPENSTSFF